MLLSLGAGDRLRALEGAVFEEQTPDDYNSDVLCGPRGGIQAAVDEGLVRIDGAERARDHGRAAEQEVLEQLNR